ncbi:amino acid/polyamine/organocation transporter (APC superfamily) [Brevibacterium sanguinis]|uniref:Amino acid/polyamine/organocation transporter (APC superfamily) n=2 Tax=Brevibacterium TaxID=1696 RepID=A0A366INI2_9MICO|nr:MULTISPECIES: APC family permease [Brevibacterium]RBP67019.1 amino acid/polyamine/organocation transporter (APC superfamily) [Brevibacterium sanguinis]RBP73544.1 amino acid/polyamine/organocation transporter (APC superfamily) [Brevibacterium celere]
MKDTQPRNDAGTSPKRPLHTWEVTAISIGFMGPVMAMSLNGIGVAALVGKAVPFTFLVSFIGTLLVAYGFIRLLRRITHAGSVYALAGITLGPRAGFFGGFALLGTYIFFAACILGACAVFFEAMLSEIGITLAPGMWMLVALAVGLIALVLNRRESATVARTLLGIGFIGIAAMIVLSIVIVVRVGTGHAPVSTGIDLSVLSPGDNPLSGIMTASVFGFLSWAGFESGSSMSEETAEPKRVIPRSLLFAVIIGGLVYVFVMFAQTIGFGTDAVGIELFSTAASTLTTLSSTYIGAWFAVLISVVAFFVAFGAFLSSSTAASRLLFALARDGFGPASLARQDPVSKVPTTAVTAVIVLTTAMTLGLGVFGATSVDAYYWYATLGTLCMVVAYGMTSVGVIRHAFRPGSGIPKWEIVIPALGLFYLVFVYIIQVTEQEAPYTYFPWAVGAWCVLGLVIVISWPALAQRIGARLTVEDIES